MVQYALFDSPLDLALDFWEKILCPQDIVIDATVGNGYDAKKVLTLIPEGFLYGIDIQNQAIETTCKHLEPFFTNYKLFQQSHDTFPSEINLESVKLIIYNLGYLPRSNKEIKTQAPTTLKSLEQALKLLKNGGCISIMCYTGHQEGQIEEKHVLAWAENLNKTDYLVSYHTLINRMKAPALLVVQKNLRKQNDPPIK